MLHCGDIAISRIFKMAAAAILDFWNSKILLASGVQRVETLQCAKFRQNWSISCEDIKIFRFFKMATICQSWIRLGHISTTHSEYLGVSITLQYLVINVKKLSFYNNV